MAGARIAKELFVQTPNKVGMLAEVTSKVAGKGVNIEGLNAYAIEDKAYFRLVVSDTEKAKLALSGFEIEDKEVVVVELENRVGAAKEIALKLKEAGIDLSYVYGSTCGCGGSGCGCLFIFSSNNNKKAVAVL